MDAQRFPKLQEYLESLPKGLDSYPGCMAKASLLRGLLGERTGDGSFEGLPTELADCMAHPPMNSTWITEVMLVAAHSALMDVDGLSEAALLEITYRSQRRLTESRMYRALTKVASPQILLRGVSVSWRLMHKGIHLKAKVRRGVAQVSITHPANVWPRLAHESTALGFKAVIEAAHGREVEALLLESGSEAANFEVHWK